MSEYSIEFCQNCEKNTNHLKQNKSPLEMFIYLRENNKEEENVGNFNFDYYQCVECECSIHVYAKGV